MSEASVLDRTAAELNRLRRENAALAEELAKAKGNIDEAWEQSVYWRERAVRMADLRDRWLTKAEAQQTANAVLRRERDALAERVDFKESEG